LLAIGAYPASKEVENEDDSGGYLYRAIAQFEPRLMTDRLLQKKLKHIIKMLNIEI